MTNTGKKRFKGQKLKKKTFKPPKTPDWGFFNRI
jgi:hypothetical protein